MPIYVRSSRQDQRKDHDYSFVDCAVGRIIDCRVRWRTRRGRRVGHQGGSNCLGETGRGHHYGAWTRKGLRGNYKTVYDRDLYITVIDLDGKVLAHGQRGNLIGKNLIDAKDPDGKLFIKERVELAREQSAFWQNYKWLNPATKEIEPQEAYCERLNDIVVCGGVY